MKSANKAIYNISDACCSFELYINLWILKNTMYQFPQKYELFSTLIIIIIMLHIIMISEDHVTEDWSNDAENTALITV